MCFCFLLRSCSLNFTLHFTKAVPSAEADSADFTFFCPRHCSAGLSHSAATRQRFCPFRRKRALPKTGIVLRVERATVSQPAHTAGLHDIELTSVKSMATMLVPPVHFCDVPLDGRR